MSSQTDAPTLENIDFTMGIFTFKNKIAGPLGHERARQFKMSIVVRSSFKSSPLLFLSFIKPRVWAPLGASGDQTALPTLPTVSGQTVPTLFEPLFVAIDALLFVQFLSSFFDVVYYLLSEPLGVEFELPN